MTEINFKPLPTEPKQKSVKVHLSPRHMKALGWTKSWQIFYAIVKGMSITLKHLFRKPVTFNYPNQKRHQSVRFRGIHHLQRHEDGLERCVGCGLCSVVCPSDAIYLEAKENTPEHRVSHGERYASYYQIDMLRCIFCGFCEEACPENAIVLGPNWEAASTNRQDFIYTKERLLLSVEDQGKTRPGMTWLREQEAVTHPVSSDLPEYYQYQEIKEEKAATTK
ncbi:MAG: NADH-quinone oxidoreductase subunit NuoI [bacterium]|jgi:NADH-quinone oxidoreductase subunit I